MQAVFCNVAALSIALLYYAWRERVVQRPQRMKTLRERVTYMLWVAANQAA